MSKIVIEQLEVGAEYRPLPFLESTIAADSNISTVRTVPLATELSRHSVGRPPSNGDDCPPKQLPWGYRCERILFPAARAQTTPAKAPATAASISDQSTMVSRFISQPTLVGDWTEYPEVLNAGRVIFYPGSILPSNPSPGKDSTQHPAPRSPADPAFVLNHVSASPAGNCTTRSTVSQPSLPASSAVFSYPPSPTWSPPRRAPVSIQWLRDFLTPLSGTMSPHSPPFAYLHLVEPIGTSLGVAGIEYRGFKYGEGLKSLRDCIPTRGVELTDLAEEIKQTFLCLNAADRYKVASRILETQRVAQDGGRSFEEETESCLSALREIGRAHV
mgnify:FL=1